MTIIVIIVIFLIFISGERVNDKLILNIRYLTTKIQYYRIATTIFVHIDAIHLVLNIFLIYLFGAIVEISNGKTTFIILFFISGLVSNVINFIIKRKDLNYTTYGASGGICGIIFFLVCETPLKDISQGQLPVIIPAIAVAVIFIGTTIFCLVRKKLLYVDHISHLSGSIVGLLFFISRKYILTYFF